MANYPVLFLNPTTGRPERLLPADGGLEIDIIDCAAANSTVRLFTTVDNTAGAPVQILTSYNAAAYCGAAGGSFQFAGWVHVDEGLEVHGLTHLKDNVEFGTGITDTITYNGRIVGDVSFVASAAHILGVDSANLTVRTTTTGNLVLTAASILDVDGNSIDVDSATTMSFSSVGAAEIKSTGAATDLTFGARAQTIALSDGSNTTLSGFTATTILGALNEVRASVGNTLPIYPAAAGGISLGDFVCLDWDGAKVAVFKADNTNVNYSRPVGIAKNNAIAGANVTIITAGEAVINSAIVANTEGGYLYLSTAGAVVQAPPGAGDIIIVGVGSKAGGAGTAQCIFQVLDSSTW